MKIIVLKFGGTSVGSINRIKKVAEIIANYKFPEIHKIFRNLQNRMQIRSTVANFDTIFW